MSSATAAATSDLPLAVGPNRPMTSSANEPCSGPAELVLRHTRRPKVALYAAVAALQLCEDAAHRLRRSRGHLMHALGLLLGLGCSEPRVAPRLQTHLAQGVVRRDRLGVDTGDIEQERRDEARPVLAADAVDHHPTLRRVGDGTHG